ncbi:tryptophan dimethylallyltransferase family protein [Saccharopolyspora mangrovi]|uniref:Tryptophan dimethylallyltransferase family protein n=1 Tax=Saccharopolyspora mangrovi TaxID=3082379 RepID=A0ABU6ACC2_9PSEU|nr:tryptophan dimethylallyltransferase family protein [Saccharopolyspora sp. S2-29]MEB3369217.1 tryptophan dimethylallyltransferase family protein [Saccharopolyspora sp. S2-29]
MSTADETLGALTKRQLENLCRVAGIDHSEPARLLGEALGAARDRPLARPPLWPSDVADDATPIEFSVQVDDGGDRHLRVLAETLPAEPGPAANLRAAQDLVASLAERYDLPLDRLRAVEDLFSPEEPDGTFSWWFSFIFDSAGPPRFKVYFNPDVRGPEEAPKLVEEAFNRLGLESAYPTVLDHAKRRESDRLTFFALDLDRSPQARVKLYVSQYDAGVEEVELAASAVPGIDRYQVGDFCRLLAPGTERFPGRPLVSSYSFVEGDREKPSNYSIYLPLRDYVPDDSVARQRVRRHLRDHRIDPELLDEVIGALTDRDLSAQPGMLAHVSLRLSPDRTGTTIYASSEAYGGTRT